MSTQEYKQNIKLGAFIIGGIVIFFAAILYLGSQKSYFNKTFTVSSVFKNVEGLKEGDNVWLSGVKIGMVKKVQIISEGRVLVNLDLKEKQNEFIKKDATASVGSDGLIGNKIVVIRPGVSEIMIENGDTINSFSPADTQELINLAKEVGVNTKAITDDLKIITAKINKGEGLLGELLNDGPVSNDLRQTIQSLKSAGNNTNKATAELQKTIHNINNGDGLVTKLLKDTSYVNTFESTLSNLTQVGEDAVKMSGELQETIAKINDPNNALGVLLNDKAFAEDIKTTLENTNAATFKLDQNMEALQHTFPLKRYFKKQKKAN